MRKRYNPDDYERILAYGEENVCEGCAFFAECNGSDECLVLYDDRFTCFTKDHRDCVEYIFVVKNAKAEKGGK